jgi:hypothetical protein
MESDRITAPPYRQADETVVLREERDQARAELEQALARERALQARSAAFLPSEVARVRRRRLAIVRAAVVASFVGGLAGMGLSESRGGWWILGFAIAFPMGLLIVVGIITGTIEWLDGDDLKGRA